MEKNTESTPDITPESAPAESTSNEVVEPAQRAPNSGLNKAQAAALKKADDIVSAALSDKYRPQLCDTTASLLPADHPSQLSPERLTALRDAIKKCRGDSAQAGGETAGSHDATSVIDLAEDRLIAAIQKFQKRARQMYLRSNPALLAKFHIGDRLRSNRANLEQFASNVLILIASSPLPGVTQLDVTELESARDHWKNEQARQAVSGQALRQSILEQLEHILDERCAIQFAADDLWPHDDPKNVEIREKFCLPAERPLIR